MDCNPNQFERREWIVICNFVNICINKYVYIYITFSFFFKSKQNIYHYISLIVTVVLLVCFVTSLYTHIYTSIPALIDTIYTLHTLYIYKSYCIIPLILLPHSTNTTSTTLFLLAYYKEVSQ